MIQGIFAAIGAYTVTKTVYNYIKQRDPENKAIKKCDEIIDHIKNNPFISIRIKVNNPKKYTVGEVFTIDTEKFYVIEDSDETKDTVIGLSMYNLNIGSDKLSSAPEGIQNENVLGYVENSTSYGVTIFGNDSSSGLSNL